MDLSVRIGGGTLSNPVGAASGTFGYGSEYEKLIDLNLLGALYTKAVTVSPRGGNDIPRIIETPAGLLNSIGLANKGLEWFVSEESLRLAQLPCAVVVNVAGATENEYCTVVERCEQCAALWGYEINVSCPNVTHGGLAFGTDPKIVERLTSQLRRITSRPLIVKLTPNVTDITLIARAAEKGGADAVSCINTLVGMVVDVETGNPVFPAKTGGLSGPAVRPVGVAAVYRCARAVRIPVIGIGGIMSANDALEYLCAGASAVQVGTAHFVNPDTVREIRAGIDTYCTRKGLTCIEDIHHMAC